MAVAEGSQAAHCLCLWVAGEAPMGLEVCIVIGDGEEAAVEAVGQEDHIESREEALPWHLPLNPTSRCYCGACSAREYHLHLRP